MCLVLCGGACVILISDQSLFPFSAFAPHLELLSLDATRRFAFSFSAGFDSLLLVDLHTQRYLGYPYEPRWHAWC